VQKAIEYSRSGSDILNSQDDWSKLLRVVLGGSACDLMRGRRWRGRRRIRVESKLDESLIARHEKVMAFR
jgi:hypothetical protein